MKTLSRATLALAILAISLVPFLLLVRTCQAAAPEWYRYTVDASLSYTFGLERADLDGDGDLDLIAPDVIETYGDETADGLFPCGPAPTQSNLYWYENTGGLTWARHTIATNQPGWFERTHIADLDGDGWPDVIVGDNNGSDLVIFKNLGAGSAWQMFRHPTGVDRLYAIQSGDMNVDGRRDLVITGYRAGTVSVVLNPGTLGGDWPVIQIAAQLPEPRGLQIADLDRNGRPDIVVMAAGASNVPDQPWTNHLSQVSAFYATSAQPYGAASYVKSYIDQTTRGPMEGRLVDLNRDGHPELVLAVGMRDAITTNQQVAVYGFNGYQLAPWPKTVIAPFTAAIDATAGDVDGDGDGDVVAVAHAFPGGHAVVWWEQTPTAWRQRYIGEAVAPSRVRLGDVDGDGKTDVIIVSDSGNGCPREANHSELTIFYQR